MRKARERQKHQNRKKRDRLALVLQCAYVSNEQGRMQSMTLDDATTVPQRDAPPVFEYIKIEIIESTLQYTIYRKKGMLEMPLATDAAGCDGTCHS